ncbi:unnamed protein product [Polarella glacialis]|uniref:RING-type domain-containing protein n=1 Tax=Polarella glacialis TaxID=89957 RepID=A0A813IEB9_POLGL|nr:unnamed protein product [Polarella glacialis]
MFGFFRIGSLGTRLTLSLPMPPLPKFLTRRVRWLSTRGFTTWRCIVLLAGCCELIVSAAIFCFALVLEVRVFLYSLVLLASVSYLSMWIQHLFGTGFLFDNSLGSHPNTLQRQQEARSLWQYALASRVVPLAILSCSVWEAWSVALPGAREVLMLFAVLELLLCTVAALCYRDTEVQLSSEPFPPQQFLTQRPHFRPSLLTLTLRATAIDKLFATSRMFTFTSDDGKDADVLEVDDAELQQDMCTICLADFVVGDAATRLPCRHIFHSACIECWTRSMEGPFIGCPLRCETGKVSILGLAGRYLIFICCAGPTRVKGQNSVFVTQGLAAIDDSRNTASADSFDMFGFFKIGSLGTRLMLSLPMPPLPKFLTKRVRWLSTSFTTWHCTVLLAGCCELIVSTALYCFALVLEDRVFLYSLVLLGSVSYLSMWILHLIGTGFLFDNSLGPHPNTLQRQQEARSLWQHALASRVVLLAILSCSVWEAWSVALPGAREVLMLLSVLELLLCTVAALCYRDTEVRLSSEPFPPQQFLTRLTPLRPSLLTLTLRATAIDKLFATSRMFTFESEDGKDADVLEVDDAELHQDMCTICLADFVVGDSATRLPCRHIFHSACIECWTRSMLGPFIGCPLRCDRVFLYSLVLLASVSYLSMCAQVFSNIGSHPNTLQRQQEARSLWQHALASRVVPLAILSCSVWEAWSVALPCACEVLMLFAVRELLLCTVAALCYRDTEVRLSSEPFPPQQLLIRRPHFPPSLLTLTLRATAIDKLFATSRMFTFESEDGKDADVLEVDDAELHQDMCTICLADFVVGDSATRLPCRHIFHSACIECWTRSMEGPFIGCPLRCETGKVSILGRHTPS